MRLRGYVLFIALIFVLQNANTQPDRWQQKVNYKMKIDFDVNNHQFTGEQELKYWNNSPDTLNKVFYHLYFNAFQPNSMMDVRSRTIVDPNVKVGSRIYGLSPEEIGYQRILELKQDGKAIRYEVSGTILEVELLKPLLPGKSTELSMKFESQVPVQIRRSGRNNAEGIDYSMSQWYPKLCEYDYQGWHANPYIGGEFYGVWGDFDVEIKIDGRYTLAAGGILKNADKIGRGYSDHKEKVSEKKVTWKWEAKNVHDFMWAADRDYVVKSHLNANGVKCFYVYQEGEKTTENWELLPNIMDKAFSFIDKRYGKYPYPVYYFIQGGDGGMEYPMGTLITGERTLRRLASVCVHELMHSWYHMMLGTNESLYAWMDEGFTNFTQGEVMNYLTIQKLIPGRIVDNPHLQSIQELLAFHRYGISEPLSTHSDHFMTNTAYGEAAYTKGEVLLEQLRYIMGDKAFYGGLKRYFNVWKFKHPNPNDFFRIMERESGLELDWFKEYFVNTTHYPDYAIDSVTASGEEKTQFNLRRIGYMPMPLDVVVTYRDGSKSLINIPLRIMRGSKPMESDTIHYVLEEDWPWTHPQYSFTLDYGISSIAKVEIDPSRRMVDLDLSNNTWINKSVIEGKSED